MKLKILDETSIRVKLPISTKGHDNSSDYQIRHYHRRAPVVPGFSYQFRPNNKQHDEGPKPQDVDLWFNGDDIRTAEAACAKLYKNLSRCSTRIVPQTPRANDGQDGDGDSRPNLLLIMLDPMSRDQFQRTMSQTLGALNDLDFVQFRNFTSVGPNCKCLSATGVPCFCYPLLSPHLQMPNCCSWSKPSSLIFWLAVE